MTETEVEIEFIKACSNYVPNRSLEKMLYQNLQKVGAGETTEDEQVYAKEIWHTFTADEQDFFIDLMKGFGYAGDGSEFKGKYISDSISPYHESKEIFYGSTDVADVSWVIPTAQLTAATSALGTPLHTWQMTAQGLTNFAHKGMLRAASSMALTAIQLFSSNKSLKKVQAEFKQFQTNNPYTNPIPDHVRPTTLSGRKI